METIMKFLAASLITAALFSYTLFASEKLLTFTGTNPAGHVQGLASDGKVIFRAFDYGIIKSDMNGKFLKKADCKMLPGKSWMHAGSPCLADGKLYVPVNFGSFNRNLNGKPSLNYIQIFDLELNFISSFHVPEVEHGAGCITYANGRFFVSGGRAYQMSGNAVFEYDKNFKFIRKYDIDITSYVGVQTIAFDGKYFWLGCFGNRSMSYRLARDFKDITYYDFKSSFGLSPLPSGKMLICSTMDKDEAKIISPEKYILKKKYVDIDANGIATFEGQEYIDLSALVRVTSKHPDTVWVYRCSSKLSMECFAAVKMYLPARHVLKITK